MSPFDQIPFDQIPFDQIPFDQIPFDQIPFDQIPFDQIPFDQIPFDQIPFDQIPFDQIPFDQIPFVVRPFSPMPFDDDTACLLVPVASPDPVEVALQPAMVPTTTKTAHHRRNLLDVSIALVIEVSPLLLDRAWTSQRGRHRRRRCSRRSWARDRKRRFRVDGKRVLPSHS